MRAHPLGVALVWLTLAIWSIPGAAGDAETLVFEAQEAYAAKNYRQAMKAYEQAANLGSSVALFQIGAMCERGEGVPSSLAQAATWYERAEKAGSAAGAKRLANMYYDGEGVERNFERAAALYRRAGELGDSDALVTLGRIYYLGVAGRREPEKAVELYAEATRLGNPLAMNSLGIAYRLGDGVTKSDAAAYAHFKLSMERGSEAARDNLNRLLALISDADRAAGEKLLHQLRSEISVRPGAK